MLDRKALGAHTELQCITYLAGLGHTISIPWGDNARYDFILEVENKLYKIQCKTASMKDEGVWHFATCRRRINSQENVRKAYLPEEVDYFCTFINNRCYLIPYSETCQTEKTLRFVPPKNSQSYTPAPVYEAENQISLLLK